MPKPINKQIGYLKYNVPEDTLQDHRYVHLIPGEIYHNRNGIDYICIWSSRVLYDSVLQSVTSGYTLKAHGTLEYMEYGSIEWNYSTGLGFEERKDSI